MNAPKDREALIKLIAKADDGVDIDEAWDECGEEMRRAYTEHAAVILAAIEAAGCAVVPVVPTMAMMDAAHSALDRNENVIAGANAASPFRKDSPQ